MKVMFAGDTHMNSSHWRLLTTMARTFELQTIVQLGDFGYWEHVERGRRYLDNLDDLLGTDLRCAFLDGNHDNHPLLWQRYQDKPRTEEGFWQLRPHISYIPRGHRWNWAGLEFLALGGAYSIDKPYRIEGQSWWPTELITEDEAAKAAAGGRADVMLSHDCPWGVPGTIGPRTAGDKDDFPASAHNRKLLRTVVEGVEPSWLFHGHYHHRNSQVLELDGGHQVQIEGLDRDGMGSRSFFVLDLP